MTNERPDGLAVREERKVVTAVFADLVGSTALAERLGPEAVKLVVGEAVAHIVVAVQELGGTVKDLAGDGVLALFGAPVSHEDDAERAVLAGLRIVQDIGTYGVDVERAWGVPEFSVRVGVNTGPVVVGTLGAGARVEYTAFGDTVNTAARLQSAAAPGTVLVGAGTRAATQPLFRWGERRLLELKGKAEPVAAFPATGTEAAATRIRGLPGLQGRFVGREREVAHAREALDAALEGAGGILLVSGEPGIGKSRLLAELRHLLESAPEVEGRGKPMWLEGRCVSYGESLPYWPFRDMLREWLGAGADDPELRVRVTLRSRVDALFGHRTLEIYPYLGALLGLALEPDAAARLAELSPEALQYRTFEVMGTLFQRLAEERPVVMALEDLHWSDPTSLQLLERLLPVTEEAAVLLVLAQRSERDHPSWAVREKALRAFPHRSREVTLEALSGRADRELLHALVGPGTLPDNLERTLLSHAEGNPFYLEELVRTLVDAGALVREEGERWRFDHDIPLEIPPTVEKVILARIDRLSPECHRVLTAASVLGRRFGLPLLEGVSGGDGGLRGSLHELQRLDLIRESRRWPQPEYRFKHALIQEAAYRTLLSDTRSSLHREAALWLERHHAGNEEEAFGLLAHHWLAGLDEDKAVAYLTRAGDKARQEYALDEAIGHYRALLPILEERGESQAGAVVLFKLALALHTSLRFAEANDVYQRAFNHWRPPPPYPGTPSALLRMATSFLPNDPDPKSAIAWPNIQMCMQLFDRLVEQWPERTIVPSLAERWEIAPDGLRYVFHLREGLRWSDGSALTAYDIEFGIKRVLDPASPGSSVAIYFVLENGQDYYLGRNRDADRIGVCALDDRTVEFRLVAPAPYFMSVMNRPDGAPQPRHAIEEHGPAWVRPDRQVVSGPFRQAERTQDRVTLVRQDGYTGIRSGNVARIDYIRASVAEGRALMQRDRIDVVTVRYTRPVADFAVPDAPDTHLGPAGWSAYLSFDHSHPAASSVDFRRALAHAVDRDALREVCPPNLVVATGGVVPPALQGHTPDIVPRFEPDVARHHLARAAIEPGRLAVAAFDEWEPAMRVLTETWHEVLGLQVAVRLWSVDEGVAFGHPLELAPIAVSGWLPGYPDPEYFLRLLLHSDSRTNEGGFASSAFDELIERARQERRDRERLELFHQADRMAVADRIAVIPLVYGRSMSFVKPWVKGWWEFGKSSASFADLTVEGGPPAPELG